MVDLNQIRELNAAIRAELDRREKNLAAKRASVAQTLQNLDLDLHNIVLERKALRTTEEMYQRLLDEQLRNTTQDGGQEPQRRARVGRQRYLMLASIRQHKELSLERIQELTGFELRRIRDQMRSDENDLIVNQSSPNQFHLTDEGVDLLSRFEKYKQSKGEPLPELGQLSVDEDTEDSENPELI